MPKQLIIIGGEGKGGPVVTCVEHNNRHYNDQEYVVKGFLNDIETGSISGYPVLGKTADLPRFLEDPNHCFVYAIHMIGKNKISDSLFRSLNIPIDRMATIVHKSVVMADSVILDPGVVVLAQSYISPNAHLKYGTLAMAGSIICHNAVLGPLAYISIGSIVGSYATVGRSASISMGANVIEKNQVGDYSVVAAGAVVNRDVPSCKIYGGIPAKYIKDIG